jgi:hypothetical protein
MDELTKEELAMLVMLINFALISIRKDIPDYKEETEKYQALKLKIQKLQEGKE